MTPREIEALAAIGDGLSNKEVALRLGISPHTGKFHVEALFDKLDVTSRAEAVHKGLKRGPLDLRKPDQRGDSGIRQSPTSSCSAQPAAD